MCSHCNIFSKFSDTGITVFTVCIGYIYVYTRCDIFSMFLDTGRHFLFPGSKTTRTVRNKFLCEHMLSFHLGE